MEFIFWFSLLAVLAWYQQQHYEQFNGTNQKFYALLTVYCVLNFILGFIVIYTGFKTIGWMFIIAMLIAPLVMQSLLAVTENILFGGHHVLKLSFAGLLLIPLSIWQILSWKWAMLYILAMIAYFVPALIEIWKRKKGKI